MSKLSEIFQPKCIHRHSRAEHPNCFPKENKDGGKLPKILVLDVETSLMVVNVWDLHEQRISYSNVIEDYYIISWSAKWLFSPEIMSDVVTPNEAITRHDYRIMVSLWKLINEADLVVTHNGRRFDHKKINSRFILNKMPPPMPYETVDTYVVAKSIFGFSSNAMNYLNKIFGLDLKSETTFDLWKQCADGDPKALKTMEKYNRRDVEILEELYIVLRPWIKSHPNLGLYQELEVPICRNCGSTKLIFGGSMYTPTGKYQAYRCQCGAVGRLKKNILPKATREVLTR